MQQSDKDDACARSKGYYARLKADPERWAAYIQKKVEKQRIRRGTVRNQREESPPPVQVEPPPGEVASVVTPVTEKDAMDTDLMAQGGKHAPSKTDSGVVVPVEDRAEAWRERWHGDEAREERLAIMEFDGEIDPEVLEAFFLEGRDD